MLRPVLKSVSPNDISEKLVAPAAGWLLEGPACPAGAAAPVCTLLSYPSSLSKGVNSPCTPQGACV